MPIINTPDKLEYKFFPVSHGVFTFKIRAPNDAHLALTSQPKERLPMYEVFIGGWANTKSVIRRNRQQPDVVQVATPKILSSSEYRGFWIRWQEQTITVGRAGESMAFMTYKDPQLFSINYVGLSTGWGASGTWSFEDATSPAATINHSSSLGYNPMAMSYAPQLESFRCATTAAKGYPTQQLNHSHTTTMDMGKPFQQPIHATAPTMDMGYPSQPVCPSGPPTGYPNQQAPHATVTTTVNMGNPYQQAHAMPTPPKATSYAYQPVSSGATMGYPSQQAHQISTPTMATSYTHQPVPPRVPSIYPSLTPQESWVPATNGTIPPNAVSGGRDGHEQLYIARARHAADLIPGKLHPSHGCCYVAFGGEEHSHRQYEVLCNSYGRWIPFNGRLPPNALLGGNTANGEPLYISRVHHDGAITIGKFHPSHGNCYIPYGGKEIAFRDFEIYVSH
uniref:Farnesoic acid O-methyl transferase domain-containing protein n=1 Tax=Stomoxys calcitrans TaxID=35570 RepID=A0A1I8NZK1_STOCA